MDAREFLERLKRRLAENGYALSPHPDGVPGTLATKRGHSAGIFLPYTDFIFLHDLDEARLTAEGFEEQHQRNRAYAEGQMKVPRALRYRVPNTITFVASTNPVSAERIAVAQKNRFERANTGEKNSIYLVDLSTGIYYFQGREFDSLSRYGGTWDSDFNPSNRIATLLATILGEA